MLKIIKKTLLILFIIFIEISFLIYKMSSKFWRKYNRNIKNIAKGLDNELKRALSNIWQISLNMVK